MARRIGSDGTRTRSAICAAAIRLIARYGYEALSMRRLAEEVGLGAAALYRYFPNKQAMLFHLLKQHMDELLAAWQSVKPGPDRTATERVVAFAQFHIHHHWSRADSLFISYMELRSLDAGNFSKIEDLRRLYERQITEILAAGVADGSFAPQEPRVTARAVIAMLNGLTTWYRPDGRIKPGEIETLYLNMVLGMVRGTVQQDVRCFTPA